MCTANGSTYTPKPAGTPCGDPAVTTCTAADTCDESGVCQPNHASDGTACDDGLFCAATDACSGGACVGSGSPCSGGEFCDDTLDDCVTCLLDADCPDDGNDCTDETCVSGQCQHPSVVDGTGCDDGLFCTTTDTCTAGACGGTGSPCSGNEVCSEGADTCDPVCDPSCNDGNDCTDDVCTSNGCTYPPLASGTLCGSSTNTRCDKLDTCDGAGTCQPKGS